jgi:hypothetical protein
MLVTIKTTRGDSRLLRHVMGRSSIAALVLMLAFSFVFSAHVKAAPEYADIQVPSVGSGPLWISQDGRYVTYGMAHDQTSDGLGGGQFMRDRQTQTLSRVSSHNPNTTTMTAMTPDLHFGVLHTNLSLVPQDTNNLYDVYVIDRTTNTYELISQSNSGALGNSYSQLKAWDRAISDDGRYVVFESGATTLTNHTYSGAASHIFLRDRQTQTTTLLSTNTNGDPANDRSYGAVISKDGAIVVFGTRASDIFNTSEAQMVVVDMATGTKTRASAPVGVPDDPEDGGCSTGVALSGTGRYVAFGCRAVLRPGAHLDGSNVYLYDRQTASLTLVSAAPVAAISEVSISADGTRLVYSRSDSRVYAWDVVTQIETLISDSSQFPILSENGLVIAAQELSPGIPSRSGIWTLPPVTPQDTTPPLVTGTPNPQPNSNGWNSSDVTITWAATDPSPSSGAPTQPAPTLATTEGTHSHTSAPSCDPAGNCATGSITLNIDKSLPTTTNVAMTGLITFTIPIFNITVSFFPGNVQNTTITATVADSVSTVTSAEYYFDNGAHIPMAITNNTASANASLTSLSPGIHTLYVRSQDAAGNWSLVASKTFIK